MSRPRTSLPEAPSSSGASSRPGAGAKGVEEAIERVFAPHLAHGGGADFVGAWRKTLRKLRPLGAVSIDNQVRVLTDGDDVFEAMWASIAAARTSVHMTTYILEADRVGERTLLELERAAQRGCRVLLILDAFGSHRLSNERLDRLRDTGATVIEFNPIVRWFTRLSRLVRNHRKVLVVDRELAFCGGMNVAEEYAGTRHGTGFFRDTQLALEGPCANDLAVMLEHEVADMPIAHPPEAADSGRQGALVQILESNVRRHQRAIQKALRFTLERALERCYLTSPYFVPPIRLVRALERAAQRGVDVRVLTAGRSDVPMVSWASEHLHGRLLRKGVRIYEFEKSVLHAKTVTVDGVYALVGSFNLDYWSYRRNLEVSVSVLDRDAARDLERQLDQDLQGAREVLLAGWERRTWARRLRAWMAYQVIRL